MSNPAALTTASSPLILGLTPFLHYQPAICSEEKGCHFSGPGETVHSIPEKRTKNVDQALGVRRLVVLGSVPRCVGHSQASLQVPREQEQGHQSWLCPPSEQGGVCRKGGPEVRIFFSFGGGAARWV